MINILHIFILTSIIIFFTKRRYCQQHSKYIDYRIGNVIALCATLGTFLFFSISFYFSLLKIFSWLPWYRPPVSFFISVILSIFIIHVIFENTKNNINKKNIYYFNFEKKLRKGMSFFKVTELGNVLSFNFGDAPERIRKIYIKKSDSTVVLYKYKFNFWLEGSYTNLWLLFINDKLVNFGWLGRIKPNDVIKLWLLPSEE